MQKRLLADAEPPFRRQRVEKWLVLHGFRPQRRSDPVSFVPIWASLKPVPCGNRACWSLSQTDSFLAMTAARVPNEENACRPRREEGASSRHHAVVKAVPGIRFDCGLPKRTPTTFRVRPSLSSDPDGATIRALSHEEVESVKAHLRPPGRVRPRTLRAYWLAEHAPEEIWIDLPKPPAHFEVPGTMVTVHDDTDILVPVELPKKRTVRTDAVIYGHGKLLSSCWSVDAFGKNPCRLALDPLRRIFGFGFTEVFPARAKEDKRSWGWGSGGWNRQHQGFHFAIRNKELPDNFGATRNFTQERLQKSVQSNACRCSVTTAPWALFFDVKIIPAYPSTTSMPRSAAAD